MVAACPFPANHGSPASIREMSQALSSLGHKVHIITYPMGQDIPVHGISIHRVGKIFSKCDIKVGPTSYKPILDLLIVQKLCRIIWKEKIDIIHAHNYEGALAGYCAKIITRRPMLYNAVNNMIDELPSYGFIRPKSLAIALAEFLDYTVPRMGDHITVVSRELSDFLKRKGINPHIIDIIPAGVNQSMFEGKDRHRMRQRYNIGDRPLIIYTGTLDSFQRIDLLLKAMRIVTDTINNALLLIVGNIINASDLERHKSLAKEMGLENNVIFTDERPLEEIPDFLASADIAVIPRPFCPGFPVKLLNYMAAGKAIVTFEGSAKGLHHMDNAIIVNNADWEEFGRWIIDLINNPELISTLGKSAQATIEGTFDWPSLAKKIETIYQKIINDRKGADHE